MNKYTDEQIIQGLDCLNDKCDRVCGRCPFYQQGQTCRHEVLDAATARFKELIEENESLKESCERYNLLVRTTAKVSETTRSEVIDEFAEELLETKTKIGNNYYVLAENVRVIAENSKAEEI